MWVHAFALRPSSWGWRSRSRRHITQGGERGLGCRVHKCELVGRRERIGTAEVLQRLLAGCAGCGPPNLTDAHKARVGHHVGVEGADARKLPRELVGGALRMGTIVMRTRVPPPKPPTRSATGTADRHGNRRAGRRHAGRRHAGCSEGARIRVQPLRWARWGDAC